LLLKYQYDTVCHRWMQIWETSMWLIAITMSLPV